MLVEKRYKHTEIGVFPQDWDLVPIDEIFSFYSTSNYSKAHMSLEGKVGCIHYGLIHAISNSVYNIQNGIKYYVTEQQARYELIKNGDVVMVDASEDLEGINKSIEIDGIVDDKYIAGLHTFLLRDTSSKLSKGYRGAILNSTQIKNQFRRLAVGMKVFGVSKLQVKRVIIPIPPLPEQTAIASALSDMDALIAQTEKIIEKKKAIKQGVMQELLRPKEGWVTKKLGEICEIKGGGTPSTNIPIYWNGEINWFTPTEVGKEKYLYTSRRKITHLGLSSCSARILPPGTILLTTRAGIGDLGILTFEAATNQGFQSLLPRDGIDNEFVYYMMQTKKSELLQNATGSTFLEISPKKLKAIEVFMPSIVDQKEIVIILQEIDNIINLSETKLQKLKLQKQGMMQALLTGKIRLA